MDDHQKDKCVLLVQSVPWLARLARIGWIRPGRFHNISIAWSVTDGVFLVPRSGYGTIEDGLWTQELSMQPATPAPGGQDQYDASRHTTVLREVQTGFDRVTVAEVLPKLRPRSAAAARALVVSTDKSLDEIATHLVDFSRAPWSPPKRAFAAWISATGDVTVTRVGRSYISRSGRHRVRRRAAWQYPFGRRRQRGHIIQISKPESDKVPIPTVVSSRQRSGTIAGGSAWSTRHRRYCGRHRWRLASMRKTDREFVISRVFGDWTSPLLGIFGHTTSEQEVPSEEAPCQLVFGRSAAIKPPHTARHARPRKLPSWWPQRRPEPQPLRPSRAQG